MAPVRAVAEEAVAAALPVPRVVRGAVERLSAGPAWVLAVRPSETAEPTSTCGLLLQWRSMWRSAPQRVRRRRRWARRSSGGERPARRRRPRLQMLARCRRGRRRQAPQEARRFAALRAARTCVRRAWVPLTVGKPLRVCEPPTCGMLDTLRGALAGPRVWIGRQIAKAVVRSLLPDRALRVSAAVRGIWRRVLWPAAARPASAITIR